MGAAITPMVAEGSFRTTESRVLSLPTRSKPRMSLATKRREVR